MPIKGLTDQPRQFCEIGHIRKGAPKPKNKQQPGADLTYFRATFEEGEEEAAEMFLEAYGSEPREINIRLPFNTVDENFDAWRKVYVRGGLVHRCDGEYIDYEVDIETGDTLVMNGLDTNGNKVKCDGEPVTWYTDKQGQEQPVCCEPKGRLKVIIPELRRLAFMVVLTTSVWDILNISRQLEAIRYVNDGKLQNVPLVLKRRPREISTPSGTDGKRARREKWLLSIEADPAWVEAQILALPAFDEPLRLPPGMPADMDDDEIGGDGLLIYEGEEVESESGETEEHPKPPDKAMIWVSFLKEANITQEKALELLGTSSVNEWVKQVGGRNLNVAMLVIQEGLTWQTFLTEHDLTEERAIMILGESLEEWRRTNQKTVQDAIDEIMALEGLTEPTE